MSDMVRGPGFLSVDGWLFADKGTAVAPPGLMSQWYSFRWLTPNGTHFGGFVTV